MEYNINLRNTNFIVAGMVNNLAIKLLWSGRVMTDLSQTVALTDSPRQITELFFSTVVYVAENKINGATDVIDHSTMTFLSSLSLHYKRIINPKFLEDVNIYGILWSNENMVKVKATDNSIQASIPKYSAVGGKVKSIAEITGTRFIAVT